MPATEDASKKLKSMLGMDRMINQQPHGPIQVRVLEGSRTFAVVEVENSEGEWHAEITADGIVDELVTVAGGETPPWVLNLYENLGFREVPGQQPMP